MLIVDKYIWYRTLMGHLQQGCLYLTTVTSTIQLMHDNVDIGHAGKELVGGHAIRAVGLAPDDDLVAAVFALDKVDEGIHGGRINRFAAGECER